MSGKAELEQSGRNWGDWASGSGLSFCLSADFPTIWKMTCWVERAHWCFIDEEIEGFFFHPLLSIVVRNKRKGCLGGLGFLARETK